MPIGVTKITAPTQTNVIAYEIPVMRVLQIDPDTVVTDKNGITTANCVVNKMRLTKDQLTAQVADAQASLDRITAINNDAQASSDAAPADQQVQP